jgi:tetratricopeptide (TPR) repeat protein
LGRLAQRSLPFSIGRATIGCKCRDQAEFSAVTGKRGVEDRASERASAIPSSGSNPIVRTRARDAVTTTLTPYPSSESRSRAAPVPVEQRWEDRRDELESALAQVSCDTTRVDIHVALAEVYEFGLDKPRIAMRHYEAAVGAGASNVRVLRGLERMYTLFEMFDGVVDILRRRLDSDQGSDARIRVLSRLATLLETKLDKPDLAIALLWEVVSIHCDNEAAFDALQRCYFALHAWPSYVETVNRRIDAGGAGPNAVTLLLELARVLESAGDTRGALDSLARAQEQEPDNRSVLVELVRVAAVANDRLAVATYRVPLAELGDDAAELVRVHMALAQLLESKDADPARARVHYERVIALDPENVVAWEKLQRLALEAGAHSRAAFCLMERAKRAPSASERGELFVELGKLWELQKKGADHARSAYELALETDPLNVEAMAALVRIYSDARRHDPGSSVGAERALDAHATLGLHAAALFRIGARVAINGGRGLEAVACAMNAFAISPNDPAIARDLVDACMTVVDEPALLERAHRPLEMLSQRASLLPLDLAVNVGHLQAARGHADAAIECFVTALSEDPLSVAALLGLSSIHAQREDWPSLVVTERALADLAVDVAVRARRLRALAEIVETRLKDLERTAELLLEAEAYARPSLDEFGSIVRVFRALGDAARLADAHRRFYFGYARDDAACATSVVDRASLELDALRARVRQSPFDVACATALYDALHKRGASDAAFAVASVLEHLGATPKRAKHDGGVRANRGRTLGVHELSGALSIAHWYEHLVHPELDPSLTTVLMIIATVTLRSRPPGTADALARGADERLQRPAAAGRLVRDVRDAIRLFGLPDASIVECSGVAPLVASAALPTPSIVISNAMVAATDPRVAMALVGASVAELHPLLAPRVVYRSLAELRMALERAMHACPSEATPDALPSRADAHAALRFAMAHDEHEAVRDALARLRARPDAASVDAWSLYASATTARAALVLSGNVDAAWNAVSAGTASTSDKGELRREYLVLRSAVCGAP